MQEAIKRRDSENAKAKAQALAKIKAKKQKLQQILGYRVSCKDRELDFDRNIELFTAISLVEEAANERNARAHTQIQRIEHHSQERNPEFLSLVTKEIGKQENRRRSALWKL